MGLRPWIGASGYLAVLALAATKLLASAS